MLERALSGQQEGNSQAWVQLPKQYALLLEVKPADTDKRKCLFSLRSEDLLLKACFLSWVLTSLDTALITGLGTKDLNHLQSYTSRFGGSQ